MKTTYSPQISASESFFHMTRSHADESLSVALPVCVLYYYNTIDSLYYSPIRNSLCSLDKPLVDPSTPH